MAGLPVQLPEEEAARWLAPLERRFGFPRATFADYLFFSPTPRRLWIAPRLIEPPSSPAPQTIGMAFLHLSMRDPKLTTEAAMAFGHLATRNVLAADEREARDFLSRQTFSPPPAALRACAPPRGPSNWPRGR